MIDRIDHLVIAAPDLGAAVDAFERATGVRASTGGRHGHWGTHNALLSLGAGCYLELIAPDPDRSPAVAPRVFGVDRVERPRLAAWAVRAPDLERHVDAAVARGFRPGPILDGRRERPDGTLLTWRLTDPEVVTGDGVVPFLIAWEGEEHPSTSAPPAGRLVSLRAEHPDADAVRRALRALDVPLAVVPARHAALIATIETARGLLELR